MMGKAGRSEGARASSPASTSKAEGSLEFRWSLLGSSFITMASFVQLRAFAGSGPSLPFFDLSETALIVATLASCGVWLVAVVRSKAGGRFLPSPSAARLSAILLLAGLPLVYGGGFGSQAGGFLFLAGCASAGVGSGMLLLLWGRVYGTLPPKTALLNGTLSSFAVMVAWALTPLVPTYGLRAACWVLLAAGAVALLMRELRLTADPRSSASSDAAGTLELYAVAEPGETPLREAFDFLWKPIAAMAISSFVLGACSSLEFDGDPSLLLCQIAGHVALTIVIVVLLRRQKGLMDVTLVYQALMPATAIVLLSSMGTLPQASLFSSVVLNLCFSVFDVLAWACLSIAVFVFRAPDDFVYGSKSLVCTLLLLAGMMTGRFLPAGALEVVLFLIVSLYVFVLVVALSLETRKRRDAPLEKVAIAPELAQRCRVLCDGGKLSERESEVFSYLVIGRSSTYIANKLYLSPNTVKSHIQRIYAKLNVGTKEEMIDLVFGSDELCGVFER